MIYTSHQLVSLEPGSCLCASRSACPRVQHAFHRNAVYLSIIKPGTGFPCIGMRHLSRRCFSKSVAILGTGATLASIMPGWTHREERGSTRARSRHRPTQHVQGQAVSGCQKRWQPLGVQYMQRAGGHEGTGNIERSNQEQTDQAEPEEETIERARV